MKIKKLAKEDKTEKLVKINAVKIEREKFLTVYYVMKSGAKYEPRKIDGIVYIRTQKEHKIMPNELLKIDMGVKFQTPSEFIMEITPQNKELKKLGLLTRTGFLEVGMRDYFTISIQNMTEKEIVLEEGHVMCTVEIFMVRKEFLTKQSETEKWLEDDRRSIDYRLERIEHELKITKEIMDSVDPYDIRINNIEIRILGDNESRVEIVNNLLEFEDEITECYSSQIDRKLPFVQKFTDEKYIHEEDREEEINDEDLERLLKAESDDSLVALLAAELHESKKISLETLIYLQSRDEKITEVKEQLMQNEKGFKNFVMKSGLVCRIHGRKAETTQFLGVYIPTSILLAVIIYVHKHFNHPSQTQTHKEFCSLYYHPLAKTAVKKIFRKCMVCALARNSEKRQIPIGRERTLRPEKPRECISMDILYFPKSSRGYSHGLIISDLYSLYISFYPLKDKSSRHVATALRSYISAHGPPKTIYSDSDQSFRGEVEWFLRPYGIKHMTSYPYCQKQNSVESQVRTFKNAYRAAILDNAVFKTKDWDVLYPLVVCRINAMITKYGMSRETVHYGYAVESSLPLITDTALFEPLEEDLKETADRFRERMGRFMQKRKRNVLHYKIGKEKKFYMNELVMYRIYVPESAIHPVFKGPVRIKDLQPRGATVRDTRNGEEFSVGFENLRKIEFDELLSLLPQNFDDEIASTLKNYRYRRTVNDTESEVDQTRKDHVDKDEIEPDRESKRLRSGKIFNVRLETLPERFKERVLSSTKRWICIPRVHIAKIEERLKSCLKRKKYREKISFPERDPIFKDGVYVYKDELREDRLTKIAKFQDRLKNEGMHSSRKCTQEIVFKDVENSRKVSFGRTTVYFF